MPLNPDKLTLEITVSVRLAMQLLSPSAVPMPFQEILAKAIANGLIKSLKAAKTIGITPAPISVGVPGIGLTVQSATMTTVAVSTMTAFTGGTGGIALLPYIQAVMMPIQLHLATEALITSISGFGGQGGAPTGINAATIEAAMLAELPPETVVQMLQAPQGMFFIKSLAAGINAGLSASTPGIVPFGSIPPPPGLLIGMFS